MLKKWLETEALVFLRVLTKGNSKSAISVNQSLYKKLSYERILNFSSIMMYWREDA